MTTKIHYRQGDVLIERIEEIPQTAAKQRSGKKILLAHGEVTGHHHALEAEDPADWWKVEGSQLDEQFVVVRSRALVTHEEHGTIELPKGKYRVTRQREYTPQEIRRVQD